MNVQRRWQLSAAVVIANGLVALAATAPRLALAEACPSNYYVGCSCLPSVQCTVVPGCTVTKMCLPGLVLCPGTTTDVCVYS